MSNAVGNPVPAASVRSLRAKRTTFPTACEDPRSMDTHSVAEGDACGSEDQPFPMPSSPLMKPSVMHWDDHIELRSSELTVTILFEARLRLAVVDW